jgi:hypothetical protein
VSRSLDRDCQRPLVPGARAELAPRLDLASFGDVTAQARGILVINLPDFVDAESADLAPPTEAATAAPTRSASCAARATRSTSTTRTATTARTVTPTRTLALCAPSEPRPRRFAIWAARAESLRPLPGFVIAHLFLMFLVLVTDVYACRVFLREAKPS